MDFLNVQFATSKEVAETIKQIGTTKYSISKWSDDHHFYKKILVEDTALAKPMQYTEKVAKFTLPDFEKMFAKQGLIIKEVLGDYHFGTYSETTSPRLIMIAKKINNFKI